jgi:hypothetical protein
MYNTIPFLQVKFLPEEILPAHHMKFTKDCSKLITITNRKSLQVSTAFSLLHAATTA